MDYIGNELELFAKAKNWKNYYAKFIHPYLKGDILEVGAGIGGTTVFLCDGSQDSWTCLEPDQKMADILKSNKELPACCKIIAGTIKDLELTLKYDVIMYIDVVEHILEDKLELQLAMNHLKQNGKLIILVPANQFLFSPFDKAIGHYRRYSKRTLINIIPQNLKKNNLFYLDSVGMLASVANKLFLKQSYPSEKQILFWDKILLPISKGVDIITLGLFGKSLLGIWKKTEI